MFRRIFWKLSLSLVIVIWALLSLYPLKDRDFPEYARDAVTARNEQFGALIGRAADRVQSGRSQSVFVALKQIANEEKIDLSTFFPDINLEKSLRNVEKRNNILMEELLRRSKGRLQLGLDLKGGVAVTLEVAEQPRAGEGVEARKEKLTQAIEIIGTRINQFGVAEPVIRPIGENRIEVQLPGVSTKDNPDILNVIKKPARLDFKLVHPFLSPAGTPEGEVPAGYEVMTLEQEGRSGQIVTENLFVKRIPEMTGEMVSDSFPMVDEFGRFRIILKFTSDGQKRFSEVTGTIADSNRRTGTTGRLAIVLDGKLYSAPTVRERIDSDSAEITGQFTQREAFELANVLNNPLDLPLDIKELYEVGPTLASDAISSGLKAAVIGTSAVILFMLVYYTVGGVVAVVTIGINLLIVLGVLASFGATLTMPGIAGIVLTVGMAVDANVLIFERIREELAFGKNLKAALESAFDKVLSTIVDANLTTLITSGVMIALGTGPVKGFGVTLTIGVFSTVFSALIVSRLILDVLIDSGFVTKFPMVKAVRNPVRDYLRFAKPVFIGAFIVVGIGIAEVIIKNDKIYGIDFVGGDELVVGYAEKIDASAIRVVAANGGHGEVNPVYQSELGGGGEVLRLQAEVGQAKGIFNDLAAAYPAAKLEILGENSIGPSIGKEVQWNAFLAIGISLVGILLYVAFRFEIGFGMGAVVSTLHDILITIGLFVLTDRQFTAPMVAAILLVAGYSINDTIVIFDRIREELKSNLTASLRDVINIAVDHVFSRSIITSGTTFIAALSLYIFGGGVINDLAFTFMIGVIVGTFSSFFIATPVFFWWHKGDRRHVEDHKDLAPKYEWEGSSKASQ